ncbi:hypothetical protein [Amorphus orientalis]|uniref:Phage terminase Nu1 subunit (DNA packaging protein) n=1 Tax=Amorphus orientalis TaxID=649198 RepID=A0AAE3VNS5_9HYPH|nr:hypothetical protein [Amorphus orientalis]MDQ0315514.1 phage terminase Nu1 subunit (DNA packaging protein) [Amorphus orientalis]
MKTKELAALLGLTTRRINQLAEEGIAVRAAPGTFDGPATVQAYIAHVSGKAEGQAALLELDKERARLAKEQADGHALKNQALRGKLVDAEETVRAWSDTLRRVRAGMLAVPSRVRSRNPALTAADVETIDREIRDALEELSAISAID